MSAGHRLKTARNQAGLTQEELGARAGFFYALSNNC